MVSNKLIFILLIAAGTVLGQNAGTYSGPASGGGGLTLATFASPPPTTLNVPYLFTDASSTGVCAGGGSSYAVCVGTGSGFAASSGAATGLGDPGANGVVFRNGAGTSTVATATQMSGSNFCQDAGSTDAYACNLSPVIASYVTGTVYWFKANTANTGAASINFNSKGVLTIKKAAGGITTDLATGDIAVGQWVGGLYDGTNFQMASQIGTPPTPGTCAVVATGSAITLDQNACTNGSTSGTATATGTFPYRNFEINGGNQAAVTVTVANWTQGPEWINYTQGGTTLTTWALPGSFSPAPVPYQLISARTVSNGYYDGTTLFVYVGPNSAGVTNPPLVSPPTCVPGILPPSGSIVIWGDIVDLTVHSYDTNCVKYSYVKTASGATSNQWATYVDVAGVLHTSQPAASNLSNGTTGSGAVVLSTAPTITLGNGTGLTEAGQTLANNTTNDVSTSKHGYAPILPNDPSKFFNGAGGYTVPGGAGSGGGWGVYSGAGLTVSGTQYFPVGGGGLPSSTETDVDLPAPSAATIANLYVETNVAVGSGTTVVFTVRNATADTVLTCTLTGPGAGGTKCNDTSHSFTPASAALMSVKSVVTGTPIVGTLNVMFGFTVGTSNVGITQVICNGGLSGGTISTTGTCAVAPAINLQSSTYSTVNATDCGNIVQTTGSSSFVVTLTTSGTATGCPITVSNTGTSINQVTTASGNIQWTGSNLTNFTLPPGDQAEFVFGGTNWTVKYWSGAHNLCDSGIDMGSASDVNIISGAAAGATWSGSITSGTQSNNTLQAFGGGMQCVLPANLITTNTSIHTNILLGLISSGGPNFIFTMKLGGTNYVLNSAATSATGVGTVRQGVIDIYINGTASAGSTAIVEGSCATNGYLGALACIQTTVPATNTYATNGALTLAPSILLSANTAGNLYWCRHAVYTLVRQ